MRREAREVKFGKHAERRLRDRRILREDAELIVRSGAIRPDADCDFIAFGSISGRTLECACLDMGEHIFVKTVY